MQGLRLTYAAEEYVQKMEHVFLLFTLTLWNVYMFEFELRILIHGGLFGL